MLTRRMVMSGAVLLAAAPARAGEDSFARLEADYGGRLGVAAHDTGSGKTLAWRAGERFAMCSTFKLLLAAAVLQRIDRGQEQAKRLIPYAKSDLVAWSPITEKHTGDGLTVSALIEAILIISDNTAANLLLKTIGGPSGWTAFARSIGDDVSRLDRVEPDLNSALPGDERDTTTPAAMLKNLHTVLMGEVLAPASRQKLHYHMAESRTGKNRLQAGLPSDWIAADKTGSGGNDTTNDIAVAFPPGRAPVLIAAYYTGSPRSLADHEQVLAEVGRIAASL